MLMNSLGNDRCRLTHHHGLLVWICVSTKRPCWFVWSLDVCSPAGFERNFDGTLVRPKYVSSPTKRREGHNGFQSYSLPYSAITTELRKKRSPQCLKHQQSLVRYKLIQEVAGLKSRVGSKFYPSLLKVRHSTKFRSEMT